MQPIVAALEALSRRVHDELALFEYPTKDWVVPRRGPNGEAVQNVVIVGGGQTGLGIAFGLQRERISGVQVLDANPEGEEGPWVTFARMVTLRTLKFLTGPDLGLPSLTFRAWHEAQYGKRSWEDAGAHPEGRVDALPGVVPRHAAPAGAQRRVPGTDRAARRTAGAASAQRWPGAETHADPQAGAGDRHRGRWRAPRARIRARQAAALGLGTHLGCDRFRGARRAARRGDRRRCLGVRQRGDGAGTWRGQRGRFHPAAGPAGGEFVSRVGIRRLLAQFRRHAGCASLALHVPPAVAADAAAAGHAATHAAPCQRGAAFRLAGAGRGNRRGRHPAAHAEGLARGGFPDPGHRLRASICMPGRNSPGWPSMSRCGAIAMRPPPAREAKPIPPLRAILMSGRISNCWKSTRAHCRRCATSICSMPARWSAWDRWPAA